LLRIYQVIDVIQVMEYFTTVIVTEWVCWSSYFLKK